MSSYGTTTVTTAATLIISENTDRKEISLANLSYDVPVYLGQDDSVTTSNGFPLSEGGFRDTYKGSVSNWLGPIYGIVSTGTADVRYWETT